MGLVERTFLLECRALYLGQALHPECSIAEPGNPRQNAELYERAFALSEHTAPQLECNRYNGGAFSRDGLLTI
eukprot:930844-Amphidinium_carterae.1